MDTIRNVPKKFRRMGVDGWLYRRVQELVGKNNLRNYYDTSDNWKFALSTHGFHNLTHARANWIDKKTSGFVKCDVDISKTIPKEILERLRHSKKNIKKHKRGFPK